MVSNKFIDMQNDTFLAKFVNDTKNVGSVLFYEN